MISSFIHNCSEKKKNRLEIQGGFVYNANLFILLLPLGYALRTLLEDDVLANVVKLDSAFLFFPIILLNI